jgi:UDP-glucose 4-epimerase
MKKHEKKARALVTGGAGFIGSHLCEALLARNFQVVVIDDFSTGSYSNVAHLVKEKKIKVIKGSIMNKKLMERLVEGCDIVFHLAAAVGVRYILENPISSLLTNIDGTEIVLKLVDKHHKKIVLASTSEVYGNHVCLPIKEDDNRVLGSTTVSRWSYSDAKAVDEFLALAYAHERKLPIVIVRFFNTVGPRQVGRYGMVLPRFIKAALLDKSIIVYGDGSHVRSFCYVKDVVDALVALSLNKKAEGEIYNLGNDEPITMKQLALLVKRLTGSDSKVAYISYKKAYGKNAADFEDIECRIPDISKIKKLIKFKPKYDLEDIIKKTAAYYLSQGDMKNV